MKLNNQGAALVTVIVIVSFISILATVILYSSGMNFTMKTTDIKTKISFYDAETAAEQLKAYFAGEASKAFETAYADTLTHCGIYVDATGREAYFKNAYFNALQESLTDEFNAFNVSTTETMQSFLRTKVSEKYREYITVSSGTTYDTSDIANGYVLVKGIEIVYTDDNYTTKIYTDILIGLPEQNWEVVQSQKNGVPSYDEITNQDLKITSCIKYFNWEKR